MRKFELGQVVITPGAIAAFEFWPDLTLIALLEQHASGNWGNVGPEDAAQNDRALERDERVMSVYTAKPRLKLWIITEADRSVTTILTPEEY